MSTPNGFLYIPEFLTPQEQEFLLPQVRELPFDRHSFRGQQLKRSYAQFGHEYVTATRKINPAPTIPAFLRALIAKATPHYPTGTIFNQCIATYYPREAGIGWHTDAPAFGDVIMAVSLGSAARLQFRTSECTEEIIAAPGSLYVMHGTARRDWQHQIVAVKTDRYSLTFRHVPS